MKLDEKMQDLEKKIGDVRAGLGVERQILAIGSFVRMTGNAQDIGHNGSQITWPQ
jgi:hypothetical protein